MVKYCHKISDTEQLKRVLIDCWTRFSQDILNRAIDQLPKRLAMVIKAKGRHVDFVWTNHPSVCLLSSCLLHFE